MANFNSDNVSVGDVVYRVESWKDFAGPFRITKITPSGQVVLETGDRFSKLGRGIGGSRSRFHFVNIQHDTPESRAKADDTVRRRSRDEILAKSVVGAHATVWEVLLRSNILKSMAEAHLARWPEDNEGEK